MSSETDNGSESRVASWIGGFLLKQVLFFALSVLLLRIFPIPSAETPNVRIQANSFANRCSAAIVASAYNLTSLPSQQGVSKVIRKTVVQLPQSPSKSEHLFFKSLDFSTDNLFAVGLRGWLIFVLFLFILPPGRVSIRQRIVSIGVSALGFLFLFLWRAVFYGCLAHHFDPCALVATCDNPIRFISVFSILFCGACGLKEPGGSNKISWLSLVYAMAFLLLFAILCAITGCKGSISNNHITINVGGGGDVLPYLVMIVMATWSTINNFKRRRDGADKGGAKPKGALRKLTQKEVADLFGPPCNADMVGNWESYGKGGGKRGSMPPSAEYNGKLYPYVKELRTNPTPENMEILGAIVKRFRETVAVQDGIESGKFTHPRSEESLYRARKG